jgi:hypothetical protein
MVAVTTKTKKQRRLKIMILPDLLECKDHSSENSETKLSRRKRREKKLELYRAHKKLLQRLSQVNLPVHFDNDTTTAFGNFASLATFKEAIKFKEILEENISLRKYHNSRFSVVDLFDYLTDACLLGLTRFDHISSLGFDPGYKKIKGINCFPDESRFRDLMGRATWRTLDELIAVNRRILHLRAQHTGPRYVWLDFDDTVITLFGNQQQAKVGYNPRYHGRPSFKAKVCFVGESNELLRLRLHNGKTHILKDFPDFYQGAKTELPNNYVIVGVRGDCGLMSELTVDTIEADLLEFAIKFKLTKKLKRQISYLKDEEWDDIDSTGDISVARMRYLPQGWKYPRDLVIVRKRVDPTNGQRYLPGKDYYRYEAIMTNMEKSPEEVWRHYNRRGICEKLIEEIKYGFGVDENSQHEILKNQIFAMVKAISYNLMCWFKDVALPDEAKSWEAQTVRRKIINVSGNLVGNDRYRHIRLAHNPKLEYILCQIQKNLREFFWFVVNGFNPLIPIPLRT